MVCYCFHILRVFQFACLMCYFLFIVYVLSYSMWLPVFIALCLYLSLVVFFSHRSMCIFLTSLHMFVCIWRFLCSFVSKSRIKPPNGMHPVWRAQAWTCAAMSLGFYLLCALCLYVWMSFLFSFFIVLFGCVIFIRVCYFTVCGVFCFVLSS